MDDLVARIRERAVDVAEGITEGRMDPAPGSVDFNEGFTQAALLTFAAEVVTQAIVELDAENKIELDLMLWFERLATALEGPRKEGEDG